MLESLIVILPTALAFCYAVSRSRGSEATIGWIILFCALACSWIYFLAVGLVWFDGDELPYWLSVLRSIGACLTLPFAYLAVCTGIGKSHASFSTFVLFLMTSLVCIRYGAICLDDTLPTVPVDNKHICFIANGKIIGTFMNFSIVMLMQAIWILCRTTLLAYQLKKQGFHSSKRANVIIELLMASLVMVIIIVSTPLKVWEITTAKYMHFMIYSVLFTTLLILVSRDFMHKPILDENEEPVYFDRKPRFEDMAEKCKKLFAVDKVYLIPSLKLEDLASMLDTNRSYAAELMRDSFNSTFAAYTNAYRVEEAKKALLAHPNEKMETIAGMCGFATAPTFTKVFKAATGLTPSSWLSKQTKGVEEAPEEQNNSEE